jgi:hypothetical protein
VEGPLREHAEAVEVLAAYSYSQSADLPLCVKVELNRPSSAPEPSARRPWRLRDRLTEGDIADLITAYRDGATATSLAAAHGLSFKSVKRLCTSPVSAGRHPLDELRRQRRPRRILSPAMPGIDRDFAHQLNSADHVAASSSMSAILVA